MRCTVMFIIIIDSQPGDKTQKTYKQKNIAVFTHEVRYI